MPETQAMTNMIHGMRDTSTGGEVFKVKNPALDTQTKDWQNRNAGNVNMVYSDHGERTTVSSTRNDTGGRGLSHILFMSDGALSSLTDTGSFIVNSTDISSGTTISGGTVFYIPESKKVKCSSHGAQMIYLNS